MLRMSVVLLIGKGDGIVVNVLLELTWPRRVVVVGVGATG